MCDEISCGADYSDMPPIEVPEQKRRAFIKGLASLPLAAILADPVLAAAAAKGVETVSIKTPGGAMTSAAVAYPEQANAPTLLLIHEWWGLNDQIKAVAQEFANEGFLTIAVDMYNGKVASKREDAMKYMKGMDMATAKESVVAWVNWLKANSKGNGKVATLGWCFGGGWSLETSLLTPVDATVIYYGRVTKSAAQLASLQSPVLGHFGTLDKSINEKMVGKFEKALDEAGKKDYTHHWYTANHAFANPTGSRYDADDAALAWSRSLAFLHKHLG
ncbi:MAG: dienelactone hydrolase family protein [Gammaproteobacteria bacterium]|nr:dienelactone hydrolase family protein [Gammaproteobacteria bacterium]